jgi:hypothetical protein
LTAWRLKVNEGIEGKKKKKEKKKEKRRSLFFHETQLNYQKANTYMIAQKPNHPVAFCRA